jgi:ADP-ribosylglycohydrolase
LGVLYTTGAVTGGLACLRYGFEEIPTNFVKEITKN